MKCRGCGEEIVFIRTPTGRKMCCDAGLIPYWKDIRGRERIVTRDGEVVACRLEGEAKDITDVGHRPHWASCPAADQFRRKK